MQSIMSCHANCVIESLLLKQDCARNVNDCRFVTTNFISTKMKIRLQPINVNIEAFVYLLMILNVNAYADVMHQRSLRKDEGHIGVTNVMR